MKVQSKILDFYIKRPIFFDIIISILIVLIIDKTCSKGYFCIKINRDTLGNLLNELVSSSVSIGGFIIAALTIILTLKDNLKAKEQTYPISALDVLFHSKHYKRIVRVFYWASLVFILTFFYFGILEIIWNNLSDIQALYLIFIGLFITAMSVVRCLLILQKIIEIQMNDTNR